MMAAPAGTADRLAALEAERRPVAAGTELVREREAGQLRAEGDEEKAARLALEHVVGFERAVRAVL